MSLLDPIYNNDSGTVYAICNSSTSVDCYQKLQVQIGDIAIIMTLRELKSFLKVLRQAKKSCKCNNCKGIQVLKCNTQIAEVKFKVTQTIINDLEELIMGTLFHEEYVTVLNTNNINKK